MELLVPSKSSIFPMPDRNKFYCYQDKQLNGFKSLNHEKEEVYEVIAKSVATRSHYRVRRMPDGVAIASVNQGQLASTYTISDETGNELAKMRLADPSEIRLDLPGQNLIASSQNRAKQFGFKDGNETLVMTVDKKLISLSDKYEVSFVENFPALVAALIPVIIDDFFHLGTVDY